MHNSRLKIFIRMTHHFWAKNDVGGRILTEFCILFACVCVAAPASSQQAVPFAFFDSVDRLLVAGKNTQTF